MMSPAVDVCVESLLTGGISACIRPEVSPHLSTVNEALQCLHRERKRGGEEGGTERGRREDSRSLNV